MGRRIMSRVSAAERLARGLLVVFALALPFETPLFRAGPLQITTVELALYAMLAVWGFGVGLDVLVGRTRPRAALAELFHEGIARAALAWVAVLFASAVVAPSYRAAALKFALRSLSGVLAFFAARALARSPGVGRHVLLALVAGGVVSAGTALVEWVAPGSATAFRVFHDGTFGAFGLPRASGVFGYPTIGAMYWEAMVPLVLVAPFVGSVPSGTRFVRAGVGLAVVALFGAILASATRSALVGAAFACGTLAILGRRPRPGLSGAAATALGALAVMSLVALRPGDSASPFGQRLRWWNDDRWYGVAYELPRAPLAVRCGEVFEVPVTLRNTGHLAWQRSGAQPTRLAYHWILDPGGTAPSRLVEFEGRRTPLGDDVPPGGAARVVGVVRAPGVAGSYRLAWDLVQENVTWFSERGNATAEQPVEVGGASGPPLVGIEVPSSAGASAVALVGRGDRALARAPSPRRGPGQLPPSLRGGALPGADRPTVRGRAHPREQPLLRDPRRHRRPRPRGARGPCVCARGRDPPGSGAS
jgi:hypothetical protein